MRTNIEIDEKLMRDAMSSSGTHTKKAAVEAALKLMIKLRSQESMRELRGTMQWEGDLQESRRSRVPV